jgi:hypothetical protein
VTWTKLHDGFWMHPKVLMCGNAGAGIFARLLSYTSQHKTRGLIPVEVVEMVVGTDHDALRALEAAGLLTHEGDAVRLVHPRRFDPEKPHMRRQRRMKLASGIATAQQIAARVAYYGGLCWICREPYEAIDHVKPLAKGGSNWPANLRPACRPCNSRKGARWPL